MSERKGKSAPTGRRRALIFILLSGLVLWFGTAWLLDPARVKSRIEKTIAEATGMETAIDELEFSLYPEFQVSLQGISLSDGDFRIASTSTEIGGNLSEVFQKKISFERFIFSDVQITLPEDLDEARDKIAALIDTLTQPVEPIDWEIEIPSIMIPTIEATQIGNPETLIQAGLIIHDLLARNPKITWNGRLPVLGEAAYFDGFGNLDIQNTSLVGIEGELNVGKLDTQALEITDPPRSVGLAERSTRSSTRHPMGFRSHWRRVF